MGYLSPPQPRVHDGPAQEVEHQDDTKRARPAEPEEEAGAGGVENEDREDAVVVLLRQEAENSLFCPSQEKFHTAVLQGVRNISDAL